MKKGQILWTSLALIPALLIVTWSIIMLQSEVDNYVEMSARYQSLELSGIINILQASYLAMSRAIDNLGAKPDHLLIDGRSYEGEDFPFSTIIPIQLLF